MPEETSRPKLEVVSPTDLSEPIPIPGEFSLEKFKSTQAASLAGVETLLTALPQCSIAQAKDFVRLHPDEDAYWSPELCFVSRPNQRPEARYYASDRRDVGQAIPAERPHCSGFVWRSRPNPTTYFFSAKSPAAAWTISGTPPIRRLASKQKRCGRKLPHDETRISKATKSTRLEPRRFPRAKVANASLRKLLEVTYAGRTIETHDNPALLRLIGAKVL